MNLDRLLKLLKLANHNSNDAEANLAAREAAKLLGDNNYKWLEDAKKNGGKPKHNESTINTSYDPRTKETIIRISDLDKFANSRISELINQLQNEISRPKTQRSQRDTYRYNPWSGSPFDDLGEDTGFSWVEFLNRVQERKKKQGDAERKSYQEKQAENWTWTGKSSGEKVYKKVYKQVCRDCSICKITRLTTDEENPYVCYECKKKV